MHRLLVADVGNTNIVIGIYRDDDLLASWRLATARDRTADEYGILVRQLIAKEFPEAIDGAIVASVVPPLNQSIHEMIRKYFEIDPIFVEPGIKTGLSIVTENPLEVGADRIVNAVAAFQIYGGPAIVVDFGTATTFDVISAKGEYRGGVIAPGLTISSEALFARAARLPRVDLRRPAQLIGTNTVSSMQSGIYFGYLGLVDGILSRMKREVRGLRTIVATGGLASLLVHDSEHPMEIDPDLTLKGLKLIYDRNRSTRKARR
ncbi:MAG TPA: type III pantothenate kinase [Thermoanaerobaculia bacterium]